MKLNDIFRDGMVLQHGKPVRIFGEAKGRVSVSFDGESRTVDADGKWMVEFAARSCGGPYELSATCGGENIVIKDIMVGELLLCSGQSNMELTMAEEVTPKSEYVADPLLRIYIGGRCADGQFLHNSEGWVKAQTDNVDSWSALAYLTGLRIRRECGCAVGVIVCAQGATGIQAWSDESCFAGENSHMANHFCSNPDCSWFNELSCLYHFMIEPLMPISLAGVIWYQGESNSYPNEAENYEKMLDMMIADWRKGFSDEELPFCVVVLADYLQSSNRDLWSLVQKAQETVCRRVPYTFSVKSCDLCENDNIHPPTKHKLAGRIYEAIKQNNVIGTDKVGN